jgi:acetylornithine deacetylase/succinyl-diaminopimelate desuccinylase-like protein
MPIIVATSIPTHNKLQHKLAGISPMEEKIKAKIETAVDRLRDEMIDTLAELVRIPSVVGNEGPAQEFMRQQYEALGLDVKTFEADKNKAGLHSAYVESGLPFEGRPNVIGLLKGGAAKNSMILNGHVDVVSPEPVDQWQHDPFIKTVLPCFESVCGQMLEISGATAGLDNRFSSYFGFPSICFGPNGNNYHSFDEFVELDSLVLATKAVALAAQEWCSQEKMPKIERIS